MSSPGFKFIDLPTAAERLGITRNQLLEWVDEGRIRPFSGKGQQSVFRTGEVEKLAEQMAAPVEAPAAEDVVMDEALVVPLGSTPQAEGRRTRRRDAIKLMGTRLSMDSRWVEMTDKDIATWLDALEPVQFDRVRKVANVAIERLQKVLSMMEEFETGRAKDVASGGGQPSTDA
ncbi:MAG: helix-turn-helix domain-containing protein [Chloroflexota bacterium]